MDKTGTWKLAPAYDITYAYDKSNFWLSGHQMCISGKRDAISDEDLLNAGIRMNLNKQKCLHMMKEIKYVVSNWNKYADMASVGKNNRDMIGKILNE